jgi:hypothetical protein
MRSGIASQYWPVVAIRARSAARPRPRRRLGVTAHVSLLGATGLSAAFAMQSLAWHCHCPFDVLFASDGWTSEAASVLRSPLAHFPWLQAELLELFTGQFSQHFVVARRLLVSRTRWIEIAARSYAAAAIAAFLGVTRSHAAPASIGSAQAA